MRPLTRAVARYRDAWAMMSPRMQALALEEEQERADGATSRRVDTTEPNDAGHAGAPRRRPSLADRLDASAEAARERSQDRTTIDALALRQSHEHRRAPPSRGLDIFASPQTGRGERKSAAPDAGAVEVAGDAALHGSLRYASRLSPSASARLQRRYLASVRR